MVVNASLFSYPDRSRVALPSTPAEAANVIARAGGEVLVFWGAERGPVPWQAVEAFAASPDDAWHPCSTDSPDLMRYVLPTWVYRPDPEPALVGAINWKLGFGAAFIRTRSVRALGLCEDYETLSAAALDLGFRMLHAGGILRQQPDLFERSEAFEHPTLADRYRLLARTYGDTWLAYTCARRISEGNSPLTELRALEAGRKGRRPVAQSSLLRDISTAQIERTPSVSVVLPTFGRYPYLGELLEDVRAQTIRPTQILIADGNAPEDRDEAFYASYADLPIDVLWHEEPGTCSGRNACLSRATGDYVWFLDDDSRIEADNLEAHLRVMKTYGADVSVGPAFTKSRPELHGNQREVVCTFMDCGTTLVTREILERVGGFDMQYNRWLVGEDGELGIRFVRAGALMVNNPFAKRFHYMAPVGGSRRPISTHRFDRWSTLPRPAKSIWYTARRYYEPGTELDAVLQAGVLYGWRRAEGVPATRTWRWKTLLGELAAAPLTAYRIAKSVALGQEMVEQGPRIPKLNADE